MAKNTIYLGPADTTSQFPLNVEGLAQATFLPGTEVVYNASGLTTSALADTSTIDQVFIAREYGDHVEQPISTAYTVGDVALAVQLRSGERANVRVATGNNITVLKTALTRNGDGQFKIAEAGDVPLLYADEIINVNADNTLVTVTKA